MNLDKVLIESDEEDAGLASQYGNPNLEAEGSYNRLDFAVRLRRDVHGILDETGGAITMREGESWAAAQAFSTYLHETIHWWQHVGTSSGLMLSFLQPAHAQMNRRLLAEILSRHGPVKPLLQLIETLSQTGREDRSLNHVINNWFDLEFFKKLLFNPVPLADSVLKHQFFESAGHSYHMALGATSWLISATVDPECKTLPHPRDRENDMRALREAKVDGFYYGSPLTIPQLGFYQIVEAQARFSQIQYLYGASGGRLTWEDCRKRGMFGPIYIQAFKCFLEETGENWPATIDSPLVGLFLLICDIALSPSEGLFLPVTQIHSLVQSVDPGWRFTQLCEIAKAEGEVFRHSIKAYSVEEYWSVSEHLSDRMGSPSPRKLAEAVSHQADAIPTWAKLMEEDSTFKYDEGNFPIRVLLARFTRVQRDKLKAPQFFCWPGMCMTGLRTPLNSETVSELFSEHAALFLDGPDRDVYPRLVPGKDEATLQRLMDTFYIWVSTYDMTRQWIAEDGPFNYEYGWLTSKFSNAELKEWADHHFKLSCGVLPDDFRILR